MEYHFLGIFAKYRLCCSCEYLFHFLCRIAKRQTKMVFWLGKQRYPIHPYKYPVTMNFSKGVGGWVVAAIADKKNQLSSPVAVGDNGHLQP